MKNIDSLLSKLKFCMNRVERFVYIFNKWYRIRMVWILIIFNIELLYFTTVRKNHFCVKIYCTSNGKKECLARGFPVIFQGTKITLVISLWIFFFILSLSSSDIHILSLYPSTIPHRSFVCYTHFYTFPNLLLPQFSHSFFFFFPSFPLFLLQPPIFSSFSQISLLAIDFSKPLRSILLPRNVHYF